VFTARYALSPYIKQILFAFKWLIVKIFKFKFNIRNFIFISDHKKQISKGVKWSGREVGHSFHLVSGLIISG
jgi:hypothetical protein